MDQAKSMPVVLIVKVLEVLHRETRDQGEEAFQPVDMLSGKACTLALGLLVIVLFLLPLPSCAFEGEREVLTNIWKFPWSADAFQVNYSPGLQTFVYTHRYPGAANVSDNSVAFAYYEEGFVYRPGDIVVLDPDPPGGANNTFIDLWFNASLVTDFQDYLCGVVAQLVAGGASGFVLGDEWPRGLNREEISIQRLSRHNQTYHDETGRWMGSDPDLGEKRALADWFYLHSIEAWNSLAWRIRSSFPGIYLGTNIDLVWEPDYAGSDVSHWRGTGWWGEVDLEPYDFVVTHYYSKILKGDGADPMQVDDRGVAGLRAALASLLDPVSNATLGRDVFLMLRAHCSYPYITTPMQMVREWNAALDFGDRLAGIGWFTFDVWFYRGSAVGRSIADPNPVAVMSGDRLLTLRCLANLNSLGECGGWILGPQVQIRIEPENITLVEGREVEFRLVVESFGWEGELDLDRIEWSANPDVVLDYAIAGDPPSDSGYLGFVGPEAGIAVSIRMKAPPLTTSTTVQAASQYYAYLHDPVRDPVSGNLVFLIHPSTCKEGIGLVRLSSDNLYLWGNQVGPTPSSNLTNPEILYLGYSQVSDLSPLSNLTTLVCLYLSGNRVSDLSPLSNLTNLVCLYLSGNQVTDLSPLSNLTNLVGLDLGHHFMRDPTRNKVSDLSPLSNLANLAWLDLEDNQVTDLSPLSNLTSPVGLDLAYNHVTNLSPLSNLKNLKTLCLSQTGLIDLSPLSNLTNLVYLSVSDNQVTDLFPLSNLTNLVCLYLSGNQVADLSPLSNLTNLENLYLGYNQVADLSPLSNLTNLVFLDFSGNQVTDLLPLSNLANLVFLDPSGNQATDLSPLSNLTNLETLWIRWTQVSDLMPLAGLTKLHYLVLTENRIGDISALVANSQAGGIAAGDRVFLQNNYLNLSAGSKVMTDIRTIVSNGAEVYYRPQKPIAVEEDVSVVVAATLAPMILATATRSVRPFLFALARVSRTYH